MWRQRFVEVILVGKNILLREGLAAILRAANFRILASVSSADDLHPSKATLHLPLYLIVHTGDDFDIALGQIALFRSRHPAARIAVLADHYRMNELASAFHAGANGYFVNVIPCDRFIRSVELVMMGETIFPLSLSLAWRTGACAHAGDASTGPYQKSILNANRPRLVEAAASDRNGEHSPFATEDATASLLSPRETVILRCITEGASNKCIAGKMDITEATVKVHVKAILRKIRVKNRTQAAIWGIKNRSHTQPEVDGSLCSPGPAEAKIASSIPTGSLREG